jgi:hypothetical protein
VNRFWHQWIHFWRRSVHDHELFNYFYVIYTFSPWKREVKKGRRKAVLEGITRSRSQPPVILRRETEIVRILTLSYGSQRHSLCVHGTADQIKECDYMNSYFEAAFKLQTTLAWCRVTGYSWRLTNTLCSLQVGTNPSAVKLFQFRFQLELEQKCGREMGLEKE